MHPTLYTLALFLHVVGAITLVGGSALLPVLVGAVRRADDLRTLRALFAITGAMARTTLVTGPLVLVAGLYMAFAAHWWRMSWPFLALAAFVAMAVISKRFERAIAPVVASVAERADGPVPADVRAQLDGRVITLFSRHAIAVDLGIVFLMTVKPGMLLGLAAFAVLNTAVWALSRRGQQAAAIIEPTPAARVAAEVEDPAYLPA